MLVINPDECIDCGVCEPECPAEAILPDYETALRRTPRDDPSHLLDDGVLPSSQRNKLREILDARDDITIESGESKDELQQMVDKYS